MLLTPPVKVALGPAPGAVNVTCTPGTGLLNASRRLAVSANAKFVLTLVFWPAPEDTVRTAPGPALTVRPGCVPVIEPLTVSVAVSDHVPAVFSVALN